MQKVLIINNIDIKSTFITSYNHLTMSVRLFYQFTQVMEVLSIRQISRWVVIILLMKVIRCSMKCENPCIRAGAMVLEHFGTVWRGDESAKNWDEMQ